MHGYRYGHRISDGEIVNFFDNYFSYCMFTVQKLPLFKKMATSLAINIRFASS